MAVRGSSRVSVAGAVVAVLASCGPPSIATPDPASHAAPPPSTLVVPAPPPPVAAAEPLAPASPPVQTLDLDVSCARASARLPGQPAPDDALLARVLAHPWCLSGAGEESAVAFEADGTLHESRRSAAGIIVASGQGCWALAGELLWIRRGDRAWDAWPISMHGDVLLWREQPWSRCLSHPTDAGAS